MKIKSLRIASALLIVVLLSTCAISGTFAKYVTTGTSNATASVAKWGVTVETTSTKTLFYPGCESNLFTAVVSGTPEVAGKVVIDDESVEVVLDGWEDKDGNLYCPLVITVGANTVECADCETVAEIEAALADALKGAQGTFAAGDDVSSAIDVNAAWEFHVDDATDAKDTFLADQATLPSIEIKAKVTIEQVED